VDTVDWQDLNTGEILLIAINNHFEFSDISKYRTAQYSLQENTLAAFWRLVKNSSSQMESFMDWHQT
jgi:hypothetical protein